MYSRACDEVWKEGHKQTRAEPGYKDAQQVSLNR